MMEQSRGCQNIPVAELLFTDRGLDQAYSFHLSQVCFKTSTVLSNSYFSLI